MLKLLTNKKVDNFTAAQMVSAGESCLFLPSLRATQRVTNKWELKFGV